MSSEKRNSERISEDKWRNREQQRDSNTDGMLVVEPDGNECGVWVGHFADDPDSDALEIQNFWGDKRRTHVSIPKEAVPAVVDAMEKLV